MPLRIQLDPTVKASLRTMAKRSRMTLEEYCHRVLSEAVGPPRSPGKVDYPFTVIRSEIALRP